MADLSPFDEDRYKSLVEMAETAISLWISFYEAARRSDRDALDVHCPQIRALTLGAFETVKMTTPAKKASAA